MKRNTKQLIPMILVFTIIAAGYSCRMLAMLDIGGAWMNYIRAALYLLLFSLWGYSLDRRITDGALLATSHFCFLAGLLADFAEIAGHEEDAARLSVYVRQGGFLRHP